MESRTALGVRVGNDRAGLGACAHGAWGAYFAVFGTPPFPILPPASPVTPEWLPLAAIPTRSPSSGSTQPLAAATAPLAGGTEVFPQLALSSLPLPTPGHSSSPATAHIAVFLAQEPQACFTEFPGVRKSQT